MILPFVATQQTTRKQDRVAFVQVEAGGAAAGLDWSRLVPCTGEGVGGVGGLPLLLLLLPLSCCFACFSQFLESPEP